MERYSPLWIRWDKVREVREVREVYLTIGKACINSIWHKIDLFILEGLIGLLRLFNIRSTITLIITDKAYFSFACL